MHRISADLAADLHDVAATRRLERAAAVALPAHSLMQRAGESVARLAMAITPHARVVWIACGPGNNGGDGFEAASWLQQRGFAPVVTFAGDEARLPQDARRSLDRARKAGVTLATLPPARWDLGIDALLGIGSTRPPGGAMASWLQQMDAALAPVLAIDLPSGLNADTGVIAREGRWQGGPGARYCLSLLTLKPGLFTAQGRDASGEVWFDNLGCDSSAESPIAQLSGAAPAARRQHASHKGSYGDVAVLGGATGMTGAALLAASAALHAGAGRVLVGLLDPHAAGVDGAQPELMLRGANTLDLRTATAVVGCGGGDAIAALLPRVLTTSPRAVLDADALNAIARDTALKSLLHARANRGAITVLTPHPLEAARLLGSDVAAVQADRLAAARALASRFEAVVVLKGSGSVIVAPGQVVPCINATGNARLATAGTGDVLAGMIGAALATGRPPFDAAREAVWRHGNLADRWPDDRPLTADALARG